ncbi:MAG: MFS transporter [Deltaproteobacteria bacterium]|nr:MFS transporter [Deltaproteobacteria bacterium]
MPDISQLKARPIYAYLKYLTLAQAAAFLGWTALYTNFAVGAAGLNGQENGIVQSIREVPGLLSIGVVALLLIFRESTLSSLSILVCGLGVAAAGWFPTFEGQIVWTLVMSFGFHYFEAINQSLTLQYFSIIEAPLIISRLRSFTALGSLTMGLIISIFSGLDFRILFGLAGSAAVIAGLWSFFNRPDPSGLPPQRRGLIFRKRYWLFYVLTGLSGARRQIFSVFAIFLLVEYFHFTLMQMSLLLLFNNLLSWILNPYIGLAINSFGEKRLLLFKYTGVFLICLAYVFCESAVLAAGLYIVDQISFCFTVSLRTYFQKIASPEDIAPSMATGVTVNHIVAVIVPFVGGMLWMIDRRIPFILGVFFALGSLVMTTFIQKDLRPHSAP